MRESLSTVCNQFVTNKDLLKEAFAWENAYMHPVCASIWTDKGLTANIEKMKTCRNLLKSNTGIFSDFRGTGELAIVAKLAVDDYPEEKMKKALEVHAAFKEHFWASQYLPLASVIVAEMAESFRYKELAARTKHIYELMKAEHPFLTSAEDSVFATLLAFSDMTDNQVVDEMERCYQILKQNFFSANAVQSLNHVLALGEGTAEQKCQKVLDIFLRLKMKGYKYGTEYELATLGVLALLPIEVDTIVNEMIEVDQFLSNQKGYGFFGYGKRQRLMHAAMILSSSYIDEKDSQKMGTVAISGTIAMIAAQQAAMCAAIAASTAASASSGS